MKIELDTVVDDEQGINRAAAAAQEMVTYYPDITFRVVTESGPGGGHPVIRYRGPREQVEAMVRRHYGSDVLEALADMAAAG